MATLFLDKNKPLHTCVAEKCDECGLSEKLVCHFNGRQLFLFLLMALPVFLFAGYLICQGNPRLLIPWILFILSYFGFIEIRVMCSHCPHYAEPGIKSLKCWANYGSPKWWKYRPGPMTLLEKTVFYSGIMVIAGMPIVIAVRQTHYILSALFIVLMVGWKWALKTFYCSRCINFACPLNNITEETRNDFFKKNPLIKEAWKK